MALNECPSRAVFGKISIHSSCSKVFPSNLTKGVWLPWWNLVENETKLISLGLRSSKTSWSHSNWLWRTVSQLSIIFPCFPKSFGSKTGIYGLKRFSALANFWFVTSKIFPPTAKFIEESSSIGPTSIIFSGKFKIKASKIKFL